MSYDILIKSDDSCSGTVQESKLHRFLSTQPHVESRGSGQAILRLANDRYWMSIDPEFVDGNGEATSSKKGRINRVSCHIPYSKMDYPNNFNPNLYFDLAIGIAKHLGWRAYDAQLDLYCDTPEFPKRRMRRRYAGTTISRLAISDHILSLDGLEERFSWDCGTWKLTRKENISKKNQSYEERLRETQELFQSMQEGPKAKSLDGRLEARVPHGKKAIEIIETSGRKKKVVQTIQRCGEVACLAFLPDGRGLISGSSDNKTLKLWDVTSGKALRTFKGHSDYVTDFLTLPEKDLLISVAGMDAVRFWRLSDGTLLALLLHTSVSDEGDSEPSQWIAMTPKGEYEHSAGFDGEVRFSFGRENFVPGVGFGYSSKANWDYERVEGTAGIIQEDLLKRALSPGAGKP